MNKKRKVLIMFLIVVATIVCIFLGFRTRYKNRIIITQLAGEGNGYVLKTSENDLIIIDGGNRNDAQRIKQIITENGNSQVLAWFVTSPEENRCGALCDILENNDNIKINKIYFSFINYGEWYEKLDIEPIEIQNIIRNLNIFYSDKNRDVLEEMARRTQFKFDNYYITALEVKNENELGQNNIENQNVILKIDNTYKSVVLLGDIGEEKGNYFLENDQDQFNTDVIQISGGKLNNSGNKIFETINPKYVLVSDKNVPYYVKAQKIYTKSDGEQTIEIW